MTKILRKFQWILLTLSTVEFSLTRTMYFTVDDFTKLGNLLTIGLGLSQKAYTGE